MKSCASSSSASASLSFTAIQTEGGKPPVVIPPPVIGSAKDVSFFEEKVRGFSQSKRTKGKEVFALGAPTSTVGSTESYTVDMQVAVDGTYSDGTFTTQHGNWFLTDETDAVLLQGEWEYLADGIYSKAFEITFNKPGTYVLFGGVQQATLNFNQETESWDEVGSTIVFDASPLEITISGEPSPVEGEPSVETTTIGGVTTTSGGGATVKSSSSTTSLTKETTDLTFGEVAETKQSIVGKTTIIIVAVIGLILIGGYFLFTRR